MIKNDEKEKDESISETLDFNNPSFVFNPNEHHDWRQAGNYLVCKSCDLQHAVFIGPNKMLVGLTDDGRPLLVDRKTYMKKGYKKAYEEAKKRVEVRR